MGSEMCIRDSGNGGGKGADSTQSTAAKKTPPATMGAYKECKHCGLTNHQEKDCIHKQATCAGCKKVGHIRRVCRSPPGPHSVRRGGTKNTQTKDGAEFGLTSLSSSQAPSRSELSPSSFLCGLCGFVVPKGNRCTNVLDGVTCKGTRRPTQQQPKAEPKPPSLHTKGAAEILALKSQEEEDDDEEAM